MCNIYNPRTTQLKSLADRIFTFDSSIQEYTKEHLRMIAFRTFEIACCVFYRKAIPQILLDSFLNNLCHLMKSHIVLIHFLPTYISLHFRLDIDGNKKDYGKFSTQFIKNACTKNYTKPMVVVGGNHIERSINKQLHF